MKYLPHWLLILLIMNTAMSFSQINSDENENMAYIGSYTKKEGHVDGKAKGIYSIYQNPDNGKIRLGSVLAEIPNPSFVKVSEDGQFLLAVSELTEKEAASGFIYSFKINIDDSLEEIMKISTEAFAPCHIEIDKTGNYVFVSNYLGGVVMEYQLNEAGELLKKQSLKFEEPQKTHTHSSRISPDNKQLYIADLGSDKIWIYDFDEENGKLTANKQAAVNLEPGSGPRHLVFSKDGKYIYSANELGNSVSRFQVLDRGGLKLLETLSTTSKDFSRENFPADIHLHPSGKFLYVSNRGNNSIAGFTVDSTSGKLKLIGFTGIQGKTPRNFAISPYGDYLYVANQDSSTISSFKINPDTGKLELLSTPMDAKSPVCIEFY